MSKSLVDQLFDQALDKAVPETWTTLEYYQLMRVKKVFAELLIKECARFDSERNYPDHVDGRSFNRPILKHFGIIGENKLSYREWRERHGEMHVTDEVQEELKSVHGIDAQQEVENVLHDEYWHYLTQQDGK